MWRGKTDLVSWDRQINMLFDLSGSSVRCSSWDDYTRIDAQI